jgi:hypothetical protein
MRLVVRSDLCGVGLGRARADLVEVGARDDLAPRRLDVLDDAGSRSSFWSAAFCKVTSWSIRRSRMARLADAVCSGGTEGADFLRK